MEEIEEVEEREEDRLEGEKVPPGVKVLRVCCVEGSGWVGMDRDAKANESGSRGEPKEEGWVRSKLEMKVGGRPSSRGRGDLVEGPGDPNESEGSKRRPIAPPSAGAGVDPND